MGVTLTYNFGGFPLFLGRPCAGITFNYVLYIASIDVAMWVYSSFLFHTYVVMLVYPFFFFSFFLLIIGVLFWFFNFFFFKCVIWILQELKLVFSLNVSYFSFVRK